MKHLIVTSALAFALLGGVATSQAQEEKKKERPPMKELMAKMVAKYDKNGDKKLDGEERKAISPEDKEAMAKAGIGGGGKKKEEPKK
jgi:2-methylcitrate dehydratase PrpD